jgi:sugar (pentulose or hexulose) kinase
MRRSGVTALVGLDVGTTGVKAPAVSPDGEVLGRAEREYRLPLVGPGADENHGHVLLARASRR